MAVTDVACPYCGGETLVTAPTYLTDSGKDRMEQVKKVVQNPGYKEIFKTTVHAACQRCGEQFGVLFS